LLTEFYFSEKKEKYSMMRKYLYKIEKKIQHGKKISVTVSKEDKIEQDKSKRSLTR